MGGQAKATRKNVDRKFRYNVLTFGCVACNQIGSFVNLLMVFYEQNARVAGTVEGVVLFLEVDLIGFANLQIEFNVTGTRWPIGNDDFLAEFSSACQNATDSCILDNKN